MSVIERRDLPHATLRRSPGRHNNGGERCMRAHSILGCPYGDDDLEALKAIDAYKRAMHRPFPHLTEVLDVLRSIGWEKVQK